MKTLTNLVCHPDSLCEFHSRTDLSSWLNNLGLDGLELILAGPDPKQIIDPNQVYGLHLSFYNNWLDFYRDDRPALFNEFGRPEIWEEFYGGPSFDAVIHRYREELHIAEALGASYVVFHVSQATIPEQYSRRFSYTDSQVCTAAVEVVNMILEGGTYSFDFLLENLWLPGLRLTDPDLARLTLSQIRYPKTGIMLDTGHLMNTNPTLSSLDEALLYLGAVTAPLVDCIHGVHLHASLSGAYVKEMMASSPPLHPDFWERFAQSYAYGDRVDRHEPLLYPSLPDFLHAITPDFLVIETPCFSRQEKEAHIRKQKGYL